MKLKNISARLHHIGDVSIAPGEVKEVSDVYAGAFNASELETVEAPKASKPAPAPKAPAKPAQAPAPTAPWAPPAAE